MLSMATANADSLEISAVRRVQDGLGTASVTVSPFVSGHVTVALTCGSKRFSLDTAIAAYTPVTLELPGLPRGTHACVGTLDLRASDGSQGQMPLSITVDVLPPLKLIADRASIDLSGQRVTVTGDRPLSKVVVQVFGPGGAEVGFGETAGAGSTVVDLQWTGAGEAVKLVVDGYDMDGLPGRLELLPWSYAIPHEDVVFPSNGDAIPPAEVPKLERAWAEVSAVLAKYGPVVEVRLFVAGYTDTVGGADSNQSLSERRAKAIAAWFRQRGFKGPIAWQGFGEGVLAVGTPDETDEAANRRALYLLAAEAPPISPELPRSSWVNLP
jgi:hypothetical protein